MCPSFSEQPSWILAYICSRVKTNDESRFHRVSQSLIDLESIGSCKVPPTTHGWLEGYEAWGVWQMMADHCMNNKTLPCDWGGFQCLSTSSHFSSFTLPDTHCRTQRWEGGLTQLGALYHLFFILQHKLEAHFLNLQLPITYLGCICCYSWIT